MNNTFTRILACAGLVVATSAISVGESLAQNAAPGPTITWVLRHEVVSSVPSKEANMADINWGVGTTTGPHIHPGDEYAEIIEGELQLNVDGQPPKTVKVGESYHNLAGIVHETKNVSGKPARSIAVFITDKGKDVTEPVKSSSAH
jgi:quercetin dioxygenase-like cupin family protein